MAKFACTKKCFHSQHLFRVGDVFNGNSKGLPHDKKGNVLHFRLLDGDAPSKPATAVSVKVNNQEAGATEVTDEPASTGAAEIKKTKIAKARPKRKFKPPKKKIIAN